MNFITASSYNLAKYLDLLIEQKLKLTTTNNTLIKNTYDFIQISVCSHFIMIIFIYLWAGNFP